MSVPIRRAIYGKLAGDTTLTTLLHAPPTGRSQSIYYQQAISEAEFPFVIFDKSSSSPTWSMASGASAFDTEYWLIKGIDRSEDTDLVEAIQSRLKALLTDAALSISGRSLMLLVPDGDVDYAEASEGVVYRHAGAIFRLIHQA